MDELRRKLKQKIRNVLTLIGVFGIGFVALLLLRDNIIVYLGIGAFKTIRALLLGIMAVTGVGGIVSGIRLTGKMHAQIASDKEQQRKLEDQQRMEAPKLSVRDKLENSHLRDLLRKHMQKGWDVLGDSIMRCMGQLEQMDDYQERLSRLLKNNGAEMLYDTEDVLDRVEQYICRNVRKVLNYMDVSDPKLPGDVSMLKEKLADCFESNQEQLRQTQEFLFALTDFLNQQGDSENDASMLEVYKRTLLESIKES